MALWVCIRGVVCAAAFPVSLRCCRRAGSAFLSGFIRSANTPMQRVMMRVVRGHSFQQPAIAASQAFLDNYSKYPMFSASDGRQSHEQLEEFDDARQARSLTSKPPALPSACI